MSRTPRPRLEYGDLAAEVEARGGITLRNIREAVCAIRRAKLPDEGRVGIHPRQALEIINLGGATGTEIVAFARKVQEQVKKRFGVEIEPEVNIL